MVILGPKIFGLWCFMDWNIWSVVVCGNKDAIDLVYGGFRPDSFVCGTKK